MKAMRKIAVLAVVLVIIFSASAFAEKASSVITRISGGITVDGKTDDWKALGIEPVAIDTAAQVAIGKPYWEDNGKPTAKVYVAIDDKNIYVCAEVKNAKGAVNKYSEGDIYQGTAVELFIGFDNTDPDRGKYQETDYQIGISTGQYSRTSSSWKVKPSAYIFNIKKPAKGAVVKCKPTKTGYILEASIPASALPGFDATAGLEVGFDIGIDEIGKKGLTRVIQLTWTGDKDGWQYPKGWGKAVIKAK
jgi:hypothetical protein